LKIDLKIFAKKRKKNLLSIVVDAVYSASI